MKYLLKPWLVLALIFAVGMLCGSALTVALGPHFMHPPRESQLRKHMMTRLTRELSLTADQQTKIEPVVQQTVRKLQEVHYDEIRRVSEIFRQAHDQIAAVISPEQKALLDKLESERRKAFEHHEPWGGPPPGPGQIDGGPRDRPPPPPAGL